MGGGLWGGLGPTHLDTPGQEPSQKVTLTRASQSPCRRMVLLTWTWQESGPRKGGGGWGLRGPGPGALAPCHVPSRPAARGGVLGGRQPRLTHFLTGVAAASLPEDALQRGTEGGLGIQRGLQGQGPPAGVASRARLGGGLSTGVVCGGGASRRAWSVGLPGGRGAGGRGLPGGAGPPRQCRKVVSGREPPWAHTLQLDTSRQVTGLGVSMWTPLSSWQRYSVQLSTRLSTQVSLG